MLKKTSERVFHFKMWLPGIQARKIRGQNKTGIHGFTLVELMVVVVVAGLLSMLALSVYKTYQKKAKTVEAKVGLANLAKLQETYFADNDTYAANVGLLGFSVVGQQRYVFTIDNANASSFTASAQANLDNDAAMDVWTINDQRVLSHQSVD